MISRVDPTNAQYNFEIEFKQLKLWKKVTVVAFVALATLVSLGFLFEPSFQFIVGRLSEKPDSKVSKKVVKIDLTKKRVQLSSDEKKQVEKNFDEWFSKQSSYRFEDTTKRKRALKLAAFYVLENKKDDNVKFALVDILEARFKQEEELIKIANKPHSPSIPRSPKINKEKSKFVIKTERKNSEDKIVIVEKEYKRWHTTGDGSCGIHALFGEQKNGTFTSDLKARAEFCDHLEKNPFPQSFVNQLEEIFMYLHKKDEAPDEVKKNGRRVKDYLKALKPVFEKGLDKNEGYKAEIVAIKKGLSDVEGSKEPTAIAERKRLNDQLDALKKRFVEDNEVKKVVISKLRERGVYLFQHELIEVAKFKNRPLIIHQKDHRGNEISTKYINGEIVPNNKTYREKDPASKIAWTHVYYEGSHFERVTKQNIKIDFKEKV